MGKQTVWVEVESDLWLPQDILIAKAQRKMKEKVAELMAKQGPTVETVQHDQLREMKGDDKVPGVYVAPPRPGKQEAVLIIPSDGMLSADHIRDLAGMVREGGYGKGPHYKTKGMSRRDWQRTVYNLADWLVERTKDRGKFRIATQGGKNGDGIRADRAVPRST